MVCYYRARYRQTLGRCTISIIDSNEVIDHVSKFHVVSLLNKEIEAPKEQRYIRVEFEIPQRGIAPSQTLVLYNEDGLCFGGGQIQCGGKSYYEQNKKLPENLVDWSM